MLLVRPSSDEEAISELVDNLWMDKATRAVVISLTAYNANYNLYCVATFLLEFSPGGVCHPKAMFKVCRFSFNGQPQLTLSADEPV